jgi:hypothetical protein
MRASYCELGEFGGWLSWVDRIGLLVRILGGLCFVGRHQGFWGWHMYV